MRALACLIAWTLLVGQGWAAPADARREQAKKHSQKGGALYARGHFAEALKEYQAAYELLPLPDLLFNIAQSYRESGDPDPALENYRRYLDLAPDGSAADEARARVTELLQKVYKTGAAPRRTQPAPSPIPEAHPSLPPPTVAPAAPAHLEVTELPPAPKPRSLARRPWFWVTLGGIAAAAGAAIALGVIYGSPTPQYPSPSYGRVPGN